MAPDKNHPGLKAFVELLLQWNKGMNLIGKSTVDEVWENHIQDSLELLPFVQKDAFQTVVDIGSGGGLPAIPLSIMIPEKHFIMTEVDSKKLAFLEFARAKLKLNAEVADIQTNRCYLYRGDAIVTSRAFSELKNILDWAGLHIEGQRHFHLLKGRAEVVQAEIKDAGLSGIQITELEKGCILSF